MQHFSLLGSYIILENPKEVLYGYDGLQFGMTVTDLSFT